MNQNTMLTFCECNRADKISDNLVNVLLGPLFVANFQKIQTVLTSL